MNPGPPQPNEYAEYYEKYTSKAGAIEDPVARLATQLGSDAPQ